MPDSDFSSSYGLEKLYGNALIDPPNGFDRSGEFVSVITSCRSSSRRCAMYLPEKPKAPVTATRTLGPNQVDRALCQVITSLGICRDLSTWRATRRHWVAAGLSGTDSKSRRRGSADKMALLPERPQALHRNDENSPRTLFWRMLPRVLGDRFATPSSWVTELCGRQLRLVFAT